MRSKENILNELCDEYKPEDFDRFFKHATIELLADIRTNLKDISEQLKAIVSQGEGKEDNTVWEHEK